MFDFIETPGKAIVTFNNNEILSFIQEHLWFRSFRIDNLRLKPEGPVEFIGLHSSCFYYHKLRRAGIDCLKKTKDEITLSLTPQLVDDNLQEKVFETRLFNIRYDTEYEHFVFRVSIQLDFKQDIHDDEPGFKFERLPQWGDDDFAVIEFDDPLLNGAKGPQVPMTQDWTGIQEPWFAEECFTGKWRKRYRAVILDTAERGLRRLEFNRTVNGVQQFYNRHILRCRSRAPFIYEKSDGDYLEVIPEFDAPTGHHICEWGYDMHWYMLLPKEHHNILFRQGSRLNIGYQARVLPRSAVDSLISRAQPATMSQAEQKLADMPIYEEPFCNFTVSAIDCPDASAWRPASSCCRWRKDFGPEPGTGILEIDNGSSPRHSSWIFDKLGPSNGCNPIPPCSRFRISALVRATQLENLSFTLTLNSYNGPAMLATKSPHTFTIRPAEHCSKRSNGFIAVEAVSTEYGTYCLDGSFEFTYFGRGTAALAKLKIERL